ncbi:MAG: hypothetical protein A2Y64_08060 [Candidatus Coatesbacteria bacterium RBG_13_66_14]|uniref:Uncharacterized protein n=1 Tax=Candidatus Coatesbacteria bacterium RBG_13_66_14 TaxID=1817816 RepID=A0A1F5FIZ9_9BACT|nr:MAG: hypothetical protein A2Y64_08060 [Candidatus Coatesbacteria bacterium RBG_13_66_14]
MNGQTPEKPRKESTDRLFNRLGRALGAASRRVGRFLTAEWRRERTEFKVDAGFLALGLFVAVVLFLIPVPSYDAFELAIPSSGEVVQTSMPLAQGRLFKITVSGVYRYRFGGLADAQFASVSGEFDTLRPSVVLGGRLLRAQQLDRQNHRYTFYVAGEGKPLTASIYDTWNRGFAENTIPYWDNSGYMVANVREADFRCFGVPSDGPGYLIRYNLDPIPEPSDRVTLNVWRLDLDRDRERRPSLVFSADTDQPVGDYGDRHHLGRLAVNTFRWNGLANQGRLRGLPVPFGDYVVELVVESPDGRFSTCDWNDEMRLAHLAVLPGSDSPDGPFALVPLTDADGRPLFGHKTPRALTPTLGPARVELRTYPSFPCLYYQPGVSDVEDYSSPVLAYLKRQLNLALTTAAECDGTQFESCRDPAGRFDAELVRLLAAFRERFPYPAPTESGFLARYTNLGGGVPGAPAAGGGALPLPRAYLARVVGPETFARLESIRFELPGLPGKWTLADFDNIPTYDVDNPSRSLWHRFVDICARINAERPDGRPHPGFLAPEERASGLDYSKRYDISDDAFRAFCLAVSYQECGLMHVLGSGRSYRAAYGHGSATGYMQLTGAVVRGGNYLLEYDDAGVRRRVPFGTLPQETRYDLRYIADLNLQVGISYLKGLLSEQSRWNFDSRFQGNLYPGGCFDFTTEWATLLRLKLAGAMYNAGPYGVKVILRDVYSTIPPPPSGVNEAAYYRQQLATAQAVGRIEEELAAEGVTEEGEIILEPVEKSEPSDVPGKTTTPSDFPWSGPPEYDMDYPGMPGLDYFFGPCGGDIEPFLIRFAYDLRRYIAGEYHFPCESYPGGEERLYQIFRMLGPFWINRGAGGDWARAALMKLEKEVIGYVGGMERNVPLFWKSGEHIFRERAFDMLASRGVTRAELAEETGESEETEELEEEAFVGEGAAIEGGTARE